MKRWQANALLLITAMIWGLAFVPQSWGMQSMGPFAFTGIRFAMGALLIVPLVWMEHQKQSVVLPPKHSTSTEPSQGQPMSAAWRWLLLLGLGTLIFLGAAMQQLGMVTTSVTNAGFLTALYVPLVPILGWVFFKRQPHWMVWPCAMGCVAGTWLLAGANDVEMVVGDWWVIGSSLAWALHVLLVGWGTNRLGLPYTVALSQFVVCAVLSMIVSVCIETNTWQGIQSAWVALAYTGFVSVGIGYTAQVIAQRHTHAADAALILSSETVFTALFGAILAGDRLTATGWWGCAVILVCIVVAQWVPTTRPTLST